MSANQAASGISTGVKVAIALVAVLTVGVLFLRSGSTPLEVEVTSKPAPVEAQTPVHKAMNERFGQIGGGGAEGVAPKGPGKLAAESKAKPAAPVRQQAKAPMEEEGDANPPQVDIDKNADDIPTLKKVVLGDPDPERRLAAVTLLGVSENPEAIGVLAQALSDEDEEVRMEAVLALEDFTDDAPVEVLSHALNDPSAEIRYEVLDALSDIETPQSKRLVESALRDPSADVREQAQLILDLWDDDAQ